MSAPAADRQFLTPPILARRLGVDPGKILGWIRSGELAAVNLAAKANGRPRFAITQQALDAFLQRRSVLPIQPRPIRGRVRRNPNIVEYF